MKYNNAAVLSRAASIQAQRQAQALGIVRFSSIEDVARHEASHAVLGRTMFGSVRSMTLSRRGVEWTGWTAYPTFPSSWRIEIASGLATHAPQSAFAMGLVTLAGPIGERTAADGSPLQAGSLAVDATEMERGVELIRFALGATIFPRPDVIDIDQLHGEQINTLLARIPEILVQLLVQHGAVRDALAKKLAARRRLSAHQLKPMLSGIPEIGPDAIFDQLRAGTAVGPLPTTLPPAFLKAAREHGRIGRAG